MSRYFYWTSLPAYDNNLRNTPSKSSSIPLNSSAWIWERLQNAAVYEALMGEQAGCAKCHEHLESHCRFSESLYWAFTALSASAVSHRRTDRPQCHEADRVHRQLVNSWASVSLGPLSNLDPSLTSAFWTSISPRQGEKRGGSHLPLS